MKKPIYIYAIALAIAGLMTISATAAVMHPTVSEHSSAKNFSATMKAATKTTPKFAPTEQKEYALYEANGAQPLSWSRRYFQTPALAEHNGIIAFVGRMVRDDIDIVTWTGTEFDGRKLYNPTSPFDERNFHLWGWDDVAYRWSWYYCIYWLDSQGCYNPTMEYRGMNGTNRVFCGSMVSIDHPPQQGQYGWNSGDPFVCTSEKYPFFNPNSTGLEVQTSWSGSTWSFSDIGFSDMKSVSISTDPTDTELAKRFGVLSLVITDANNSADEAALLFQYNESTGTMTAYNVAPCFTTHTTIDVPGNKVHSVYDYYNADTFQNGLFARMDDYAQMKQYTGGETLWWNIGYSWTMTDANLNIADPCVAANNGNVVVVTEIANITTGDVDLVAWYTTTGNVSDFNLSAIAYSDQVETHPEVEWVGGNSFVCAFFMNGGVYMSRSNNAGANWSEPVLISGTDNVVDALGTIDISANGYKITYAYIVDANHWMYRIVRLGTNLYIDTVQIFEGMATCPVGNEPALAFNHPMVVTVRDPATGDPISGIPAANFHFTVSAEETVMPWRWPYNPLTHSYGTLGLTFTPIDAQTDVNGQIRFTIMGATSIFGNVQITCTVNGQTTNNVMRLACKSPDYNTDGGVTLGDFTVFGSDYTKTVDYGSLAWRSDFTNDGAVTLGDFSLFGQHYTHTHP